MISRESNERLVIILKKSTLASSGVSVGIGAELEGTGPLVGYAGVVVAVSSGSLVGSGRGNVEGDERGASSPPSTGRGTGAGFGRMSHQDAL
jgi:hypothetical protein